MDPQYLPVHVYPLYVQRQLHFRYNTRVELLGEERKRRTAVTDASACRPLEKGGVYDEQYCN